ncbi:MAG: hypothetical protein R3C51_08530 [Parvularculaceae bacterium]
MDVNRLGVLQLMQRGEELFRGSARCARVEHRSGKLFSGFALDKSQFDLAELQRLNARAIAKSRISPFSQISEAYRAHCSDLVAFVGAHCMQIERFMAPFEGQWSDTEQNAIFTEILAGVEQDWRVLLQRGNEFALDVRPDKGRLMAMKRFTEACVTPALIDGASWNRCYFKPMGYPGDYQIMNYMYDQKPEGTSLKEQFLHGLGLIAGRPIYTRMRLLADLVVKHCQGLPVDEPIRIASIGSGPARELEYVVAATDPSKPIIATLIDQEVAALEYAVDYVNAHRATENIQIRALNASFKSMFNPAGLGGLCEQDMIYSLGLVDYFSPLMARRFVSRAYDLVRPGGKVVIGNASDCVQGTIWTMEHILDWGLYFRSREEMLDLASDISDAKVSVTVDPLESIYFLIVEKPA